MKYDFENATYEDSFYFTIEKNSGKILTKEQMPMATGLQNYSKNTKSFFDFWVIY